MMWYICKMEYYSSLKRTTIVPFAEMWMNLETIIQSEVRKTNTPCIKWASQVVLVVKNLPANAGDMGIRCLGGEDLLEEGTATHSSILAWRIPWTEEPVRLLSPWGHKETDLTEVT